MTEQEAIWVLYHEMTHVRAMYELLLCDSICCGGDAYREKIGFSDLYCALRKLANLIDAYEDCNDDEETGENNDLA